MADRVTMTVVLQVTVPQAVALKAMFDYWNACGNQGGSREVAFNVDGDGDFHPHAQMLFNPPLPYAATLLAEKAVASDKHGDRLYDYDAIAWALHKDNVRVVSAPGPQTEAAETEHLQPVAAPKEAEDTP